MSQTDEKAFEAYAEEILLTRGGWQLAAVPEWEVERALFPGRICAFLKGNCTPALMDFAAGEDDGSILYERIRGNRQHLRNLRHLRTNRTP